MIDSITLNNGQFLTSTSVNKFDCPYMMTSSNGKFSALLVICAGNSPATGEFPTQRPVTRSFGVFFDLHLNKRSSKQSWGWWFETPLHQVWRHCIGYTFSLRLLFGITHKYTFVVNCCDYIGTDWFHQNPSGLPEWYRWPLLLTWFNFDPSMDK